ncbi:unnamed protein product, partial [Prorocentrum cordatum]
MLQRSAAEGPEEGQASGKAAASLFRAAGLRPAPEARGGVPGRAAGADSAGGAPK